MIRITVIGTPKGWRRSIIRDLADCFEIKATEFTAMGECLRMAKEEQTPMADYVVTYACAVNSADRTDSFIRQLSALWPKVHILLYYCCGTNHKSHYQLPRIHRVEICGDNMMQIISKLQKEAELAES